MHTHARSHACAHTSQPQGDVVLRAFLLVAAPYTCPEPGGRSPGSCALQQVPGRRGQGRGTEPGFGGFPCALAPTVLFLSASFPLSLIRRREVRVSVTLSDCASTTMRQRQPPQHMAQTGAWPRRSLPQEGPRHAAVAFLSLWVEGVRGGGPCMPRGSPGSSPSATSALLSGLLHGGQPPSSHHTSLRVVQQQDGRVQGRETAFWAGRFLPRGSWAPRGRQVLRLG